MQISRHANLKRMISDKASQNDAIDERGGKPTKASKKVKRCCFFTLSGHLSGSVYSKSCYN